jgi:hypothetical protein|tara:strand:- start:133 stop:684 length:552 start_codon:yes stop_codon:yes gene_type:complete
MQKKVLTEVDLYHGEVDMPKGFEIDRDQIRNDIIESFVKKKRINDNPMQYSFDDYVVNYSQPLQWLQDYIRDHWKVEYGHTLVTRNIHGNVMHPQEKSWVRCQVDPVDLRNSPDYTLIYAVDVKEGSSECIIEYDDNRRKNRTWHIPIKDNHFIMFPATNKYSFSPNTSNGLNIILTINYEYI